MKCVPISSWKSENGLPLRPCLRKLCPAKGCLPGWRGKMPTSSRRGRTGAGCGRCVLLGVSAFTSPSVRPPSGSQGRSRRRRLAGRFPPLQSASHQTKRKTVLNRAELRMGRSPDEGFPSPGSPACAAEGWPTPSASYSKRP